jgi:hypothetical protein
MFKRCPFKLDYLVYNMFVVVPTHISIVTNNDSNVTIQIVMYECCKINDYNITTQQNMCDQE